MVYFCFLLFIFWMKKKAREIAVYIEQVSNHSFRSFFYYYYMDTIARAHTQSHELKHDGRKTYSNKIHTHFMFFVRQQNDNCVRSIRQTRIALELELEPTENLFIPLLTWFGDGFLVTPVWRPPFVTPDDGIIRRFFGFIFERNLKIDAKFSNSVPQVSSATYSHSLALYRVHCWYC